MTNLRPPTRTTPSYWEIFYNPDIPWGLRVLLAAPFPVIAPLVAVSACASEEPHESEPIPQPYDVHSLPPSIDAKTPSAPDAGSTPDVPPCIPEPCVGGIVDPLIHPSGKSYCARLTPFSLPGAIQQKFRGAVVQDLTQDSFPDIVLLPKEGLPQLLINQKGQSFTTAPAETFPTESKDSRFATFADYDQDGDLDVVVGGKAGSRLLQNQQGVFTVFAPGEGMADPQPARTAAWLGASVMLGTENGLRLYGQNQLGTFVEQSQEKGVVDTGDATRLAIADYDGDGVGDVFVANMTGKDRLLRRNSSGQFMSVEDAAKIAFPGLVQSMDAEWVVMPGNKNPALYVAKWDGANSFFLNDGNGIFSDQATSFNLRDPGNSVRIDWGKLIDAPHPALVIGRWEQSILVYLPTYSGSKFSTYKDYSYPLGLSTADAAKNPVPENGVEVEWADFNQDGTEDLLIVLEGGIRLYLNQSRVVKTCPKEGS